MLQQAKKQSRQWVHFLANDTYILRLVMRFGEIDEEDVSFNLIKLKNYFRSKLLHVHPPS